MQIRSKLALLAGTALLLGVNTAASPIPAGADPLFVDALCEPDSGTCEAYASGGSGGNTFVWSGAAVVGSGTDYSVARVNCTYRRGKTIQVTVSVTDGSGASASDTDYYYCR